MDDESETRPPKTAQGAASRERLLDAAIELIAERGYSASSVEALCRRAGVAKTALYWHFGS
jgi:AcrR family transcriptional regulator